MQGHFCICRLQNTICFYSAILIIPCLFTPTHGKKTKIQQNEFIYSDVHALIDTM